MELKYKLVLVEWLDSFGCSSNWEDIDDDMKPIPLTCFSAGYVIYEDNRCITVCPHLAVFEDKRQGCGDMTIPRASIVSIRSLQKVENNDISELLISKISKIDKFRSTPLVNTGEDRARISIDLQFPDDLRFYNKIENLRKISSQEEATNKDSDND